MGTDTPQHSRASLPTLSISIVRALVLVALGLGITVAGLGPLFAMAGTGPAEATVDGGSVPADVQLRVGDTATLDGGALQVTLTQVVEDSRCPKDVMCVWQGRAVVELHVSVDGIDKGLVTASLMPGSPPSPALDATVERYVFSLTDLQPYPKASQPQALDQRVATLHVRPWTP